MQLVVLVTVLVSATHSCQEIRVKAEDGGVVLGRSFDFSDIPTAVSYLETEPAGTEHKAPALPNCAGDPFSFKNRWKTILAKGKVGGKSGDTALDGVNDAGLSTSVLYFDGNAEFTDPESITGTTCDNAIPQTMTTSYILAAYQTVEEVRKDLEEENFPVVWAGIDISTGVVHPIHFNIMDRTGAGLVLEHVREGVKWYDNTIGVLTNSPPYPWHMENLRNYPHFQKNDKGREGFKYSSLGHDYSLSPQWTGSGLLGLPGDWTSPSRFVKAATLLALAPTPATTDDAIVQVFHHMNAADIPFGIMEKKVSNLSSFNWWVLVKDLTRRCVYYRAYIDLSVKKICLKDAPEVLSKVKVEGKFNEGIWDESGQMEPVLPDEHTEL